MTTLRDQIVVCEFIPVRDVPTIPESFPDTRRIRSTILPVSGIVADDVTNYAEISDEADSIKEFMQTIAARGYFGLAPEAIAQPQVNGYTQKRFFVDKDLNVYYNPVITDQSDPVCADEYCLSFPHGDEVETTRYFSVTVSYYDETDTLHEDVVLTSLDAVVWQHMIDHLNGIFIYS